VILPLSLLVVAAAASVAACALALGRRRSPGLGVSLVVISAWLAIGLGGAVLLGDRSPAGEIWLLVVLFLVPLPVIPWLYVRSFDSGSAKQAERGER